MELDQGRLPREEDSMLNTKVVREPVNKIVSMTCSRCKKEITPDNFPEWDEIISIPISGGYGSVFGDGASGRVDLCQHCAKELLGDLIEWSEEG